ncbi:SDR family oxidoreductase [Pseudonocardia humida]|uniref:NAD(P)H-binding protein n=1 Tax=Pseudonocardia humida TaxID=2800819 RepID=A0ABT1A912_9PSEU|nr:NAD(P)H-binding protein [Pseudonocardia humida]MCO1659517.1 NAD(P)H-binding protein [Pseudonocardia humida]
MSGTILVTGGTGTLGRAVVARLREAGAETRVLSRKPGPDRVVGDLDTGAGLDEAVRGVAVVVHAATRHGHDVAGTERLVAALRRTAPRAHLLYVSIVGVDRVPLPYYREKLAVEEVVRGSAAPWTIQRITQFHTLLDAVFAALARLPLMPVLAGTDVQPIDVGDAAARVAALALDPPGGRAPDLAGPQVRPMADFAAAWLAARGKRRRLLPVRLPGRIARGYRDGGHLAPEHADGTVTFEDFLAARPDRTRPR